MLLRLGCFCFFLCLGLSCGKFQDPPLNFIYHVPPSGEFPVSSLQAEGLDEALISQMTDLILREQYKRINSLIILKNGKLVYEEYFHGHSEDILQNMFSASKSITSLLAGIAIDKGIIANADASVVAMLPEYTDFLNPDPRKNQITVQHLLNMSSGLDCEDWYGGTENEMQESSDPVKFTLDLPMIADPGTRGSYCTGGVITLGRAIENQSHLSLEEFANTHLFGPLGITRYKWDVGVDGRISGGGKLFLRSRDMAKIGLLMLAGGIWNGRRIVSEDWIAKSAENQIKLPGPFDGYGYLWWKQGFKDDIPSYFASGNGGQDIFVFPTLDMTLVFTSGNKNTALGLQNIYMIRDYILPAIE